MIRNQIIEAGGRQWRIRHAISMAAANSAIASARVSGSVGYKTMQYTQLPGESVSDYVARCMHGDVDQIIADVVQINSDGTDRQPYQEAY